MSESRAIPHSPREMAKIVPIFHHRWASLFGKIIDRAAQLNAETNYWLTRSTDGVLLSSESQTPLVQYNYELRDAHHEAGLNVTTGIDIPLDSSRLHLAHALTMNRAFLLTQNEYHGILYRPTASGISPDTLSLFSSPSHQIADTMEPILRLFTEEASDNEGPSSFMIIPHQEQPDLVHYFEVDHPNKAYAGEQLGRGVSNAAETAAFMDDGPYGLAFQRMTTMLGTMTMLAGEDPRLPFGS